jgi:hypothetical protein
MSQATTLILLPQTYYQNNNVNVVGEKVQAAAYYLGNQDLQTLSWSLNSFYGVIDIQATLASDPTANSDWFNVHQISGNNTTTNSFANLTGNYVWLRAKVSFNNSTGNPGVIQYVKVSY